MQSSSMKVSSRSGGVASISWPWCRRARGRTIWPYSGGRPVPLVGRQLVASRSEVPGHAQHEAPQPGLAQLAELEAGVQDGHLVSSQLVADCLRQTHLQHRLAGLAGRHALDHHRQAQGNLAHAAHPHRQPKRDRRQRLSGPRLIVLRRQARQPRPEERRQIHCHRSPSVVIMRLPSPFLLHHCLPVLDELFRPPHSTPQRPPRPPHLRRWQAHRVQSRKHRSPRAQQPPADDHPHQVHQSQVGAHRHALDHIRQHATDTVDYLRHRAGLLLVLAFGDYSPMSPL